MRDDLADDGRDRVAVAEHPALDLDAVDELLDQHLVVVPARERDRGASSLVVRTFEMPTEEPRRAGFTNTG